MDSIEIKQIAHALGADLCVIAAANRFWEVLNPDEPEPRRFRRSFFKPDYL